MISFGEGVGRRNSPVWGLREIRVRWADRYYPITNGAGNEQEQRDMADRVRCV